RPAGHERQPCSKNSRLQLVEPAVACRFDVLIASGLAAVSQSGNPGDAWCAAGDHGTAISKRAEILGRIEAERGRVSIGSNWTSVRRREVCLTAVFDDRERVTLRKLANAGHIWGLTAQVHRARVGLPGGVG